MIVKLPFPPSELMPNKAKGRHWGSLHSAKSTQRDGAFYATKQAMKEWKEPDGDIALSILFITPDRVSRDVDNLLAASKSAIDGVALALGVNDKRFRPLLVDWSQGAKPGAMVVAVGIQVVSFQEIVS